MDTNSAKPRFLRPKWIGVWICLSPAFVYLIIVTNHVIRNDIALRKLESHGGRNGFYSDHTRPITWLNYNNRRELKKNVLPSLDRLFGKGWIGRFKTITGIDYRGTSITDKDLKSIAHLRGMSWLCLSGTSVTDDGLIHLSKLDLDNYLMLQNTQIKGHGLKHLVPMKRLQKLDLSDSPVNSSGVVYLKQMTHLKNLRLIRTHLTPAEKKEISLALPGCNVYGI